jgi:hypothetical protein
MRSLNITSPKFCIAFLLLLILLGSCHENEIKKEADIEWQKSISLFGEQGLMNSANINGQLNVLSGSVLFKNVNTDATASDLFRIGPYYNSGRLKFPISSKFYAITDFDKILIRTTETNENESTEAQIKLTDYDENFFRLTDIPYWQGDCIGLTENNRILIPYESVSDGILVSSPYFLMTTVVINVGNQVEIKNVKLIQNNLFSGSTTVYSIQTFFDQFFVVMGSSTYRIDEGGSIFKISDKAERIFIKNNALFSVSSNFNTQTTELRKSVDQGKSWQTLGTINVDITALNFTTVDQKLVAFGKAQIFLIEINEPQFSVTELENKGLGLSDITSISKSGDNHVLITTHCNSLSTDCGAYIKPLSKFFDMKRHLEE